MLRKGCFVRFLRQSQVLSADRSCLFGLGEEDTFTNGNLYPAFKQKKQGRERLLSMLFLNCFQLNMILTATWHMLTWHLRISFGCSVCLELSGFLLRGHCLARHTVPQKSSLETDLDKSLLLLFFVQHSSCSSQTDGISTPLLSSSKRTVRDRSSQLDIIRDAALIQVCCLCFPSQTNIREEQHSPSPVTEINKNCQGPWEQGCGPVPLHPRSGQINTQWECHFRVSVSLRKLMAILRRAEGQRGSSMALETGRTPCKTKHSEEGEARTESNAETQYSTLRICCGQKPHVVIPEITQSIDLPGGEMCYQTPIVCNMLQTCRGKCFHSILNSHCEGYGTAAERAGPVPRAGTASGT